MANPWNIRITREGMRGMGEAAQNCSRLREMLRPIWQRTFAQTWRPEIPDDRWFTVKMTTGELRAIAALFVEGADGPSQAPQD